MSLLAVSARAHECALEGPFNQFCVCASLRRSMRSVSIDLSTSVKAALKVLLDTQANLTTTQRRVATGLRVGTAKDNATYWTIATKTRSDIGAVSAVQDALGLA